ncbi:DUF551 domain-containing protein [Phocaeicola dorei]|uniref:DUF551 domain-containing protein n=1 Tax=Phocaeicola dorei TaxID=357276 RepID=UPI001BDDD81C|nr:DUF551 domain-containing protein [Phocaeicola dorei]MBT1308952.1 DUF551 domain-containing protein [Phocaeicola dorei]MBT1313665.1 DUF551 domain-containing protein [Phocaeicola dorei]
MKQTVEEAAVDFADYELKNLDKLSFVVSAKADYDNGLTKGFKSGAEWQSNQSPWISVKERLPEEGKPVLIRLKDSVIRLACYDIEEDSNIYFWNDNYAYETFRPWDVTHWREIPSFDEILEANRDVLERIKEKGD